jgi:hypothetical protein
MLHRLRGQFWMESILASITGTAAVVTLFRRQWIEAVFGVDPDRGNGSAEWLAVIMLMIVTAAFVFAARIEWRRARLSHR